MSVPYRMVEYLALQCLFFSLWALWLDTWRLCPLERQRVTLWFSTEKEWSRDRLWHRNQFGSCPAIPAASCSCSLLWRELKAITHWHHTSAKRPTQPSWHHSCMCVFTTLLLTARDLPKTSLGEWEQWSPIASTRKQNIWRTRTQRLSPSSVTLLLTMCFFPQKQTIRTSHTAKKKKKSPNPSQTCPAWGRWCTWELSLKVLPFCLAPAQLWWQTGQPEKHEHRQ